jgi:PHP domain
MPRFIGVAHVHSTYSFDGRLKLSEVAQFFRSQGLDFVLMSEHIEGLCPDRIREFVRECRELSDSTFQIIPGIEMDEFHILLLGVDEPDNIEDHRLLREHFLERGSVMVLSHPIKIQKGIAADVRSRLVGLEVWNSRHDGKFFPRMSNVDLLRKFREDGQRLTAICGLDFHSRDDDVDIRLEVQAEARSVKGILQALRDGKTYVSKAGKEVPIGGLLIKSGTSLYRMKAVAYRTLYALSYRLYKGFKRTGLRIPTRLRHLGRRLF